MYEKEEQIVKLFDWPICFEELINQTITSCMSKSTCKFVYLLCNFLDNIFKQLWYQEPTCLNVCSLFQILYAVLPAFVCSLSFCLEGRYTKNGLNYEHLYD